MLVAAGASGAVPAFLVSVQLACLGSGGTCKDISTPALTVQPFSPQVHGQVAIGLQSSGPSAVAVSLLHSDDDGIKPEHLVRRSFVFFHSSCAALNA